MSEAGKFLIYCIEMYRRAKHISSRAAYEIFRSVGADDYVRRCYGALHTTGEFPCPWYTTLWIFAARVHLRISTFPTFLPSHPWGREKYGTMCAVNFGRKAGDDQTSGGGGEKSRREPRWVSRLHEILPLFHFTNGTG